MDISQVHRVDDAIQPSYPGLPTKAINPLKTSLVVQRLGLQAANAGSPGLIPGQGTRSRMLQLELGAAKQIKINFFFFLNASHSRPRYSLSNFTKNQRFP